MRKFLLIGGGIVLACALFFGAKYSGWVPELGAPAGESPGGAAKEKARGKGQPEPYFGDFPSLAAVNVRNAVLEEVISGLDYPWAFEFISDDEMIITLFSGELKRLNLAKKSLVGIEGLPKLPDKAGSNQIGLMDVALHPDFAENGVLFISHATQHPSKADHYATAVSKARLSDAALEQLEQILVAKPYGNSPSNFGGALAFDRDGNLLIGSGDRSKRDHAQNGKYLTGKILRVTETGEPAPGNPFTDNPSIDDRIIALGIRNPQGLVFDETSGLIFETEHGPMGGDEVNVIAPGRNYGWPVITYGANYTTQRIGRGSYASGYEQPLYYYLPSLAISPLARYWGTMFPEWNGDLLVGSLKGGVVSKLDLVDGAIKSDQRILDEAEGRIRDIKIAQDGSIYVLVQNGGRILRLYRDPALDVPTERSGQNIYRLACATCHSSGGELIPQIDNPASWGDRLDQPADVLKRNAITGIGDMPARGFCENCAEEEVGAAVDFMLEKLKK